MTLACSLSSVGPGWTSVAIFGVPLLGILLGRIVLARSLRLDSTGGRATAAEPSPAQLPDFPPATRPEPTDELVGVSK